MSNRPSTIYGAQFPDVMATALRVSDRHGVCGRAVVTYKGSPTNLTLRYEGQSRRYVWRTESGASVQAGTSAQKALDLLREHYASLTRGGPEQPTLESSELVRA